jgi:2-amino-4-hydroxy-6-hydroxymethyldihydropteridine diphosphokinase
MPQARQTRRAFVGVGSNLGDRRRLIATALRLLNAADGVRVVRVATLVETPSEGGPIDAPDYLNTVAEVVTWRRPLALLDVLQEIERKLGRERPFVNAPRTMDLDLLVYESVTLNSPRLTLPHPRMAGRAFVMKPLAEIAPAVAATVASEAAYGAA